MDSSRSVPKRINYLKKLLFRRKAENDFDKNTNSDLAKCLTTFDLTNLGIGSILGAGIYVVVGQVAANISGPSVVISLSIAAITSLLSGLCYAEFGSRVPRTTGSAYAYSYHTVGELIAFIIGWNLILEYMIGTAADARALSSAVDYLLDHRISNFSLSYVGRVPLTGAVPDILGFTLTITVTLVLAAGVKESARYTVFFNFLTAGVAIFIIAAGSLKSERSNWNSTTKFFPKGVHGVLSGAATCFYAYVGYDIIATTGEEAKSPSKSIPKAMAFTLLICFSFYLGVAVVLTMMVPFGALHTDSPITEAFDYQHLHWVKWIVGIGGVAGMSASLMGSEFPLPRIIYAMASDGLLFRCLSFVWNKTEVPIFATLIPGFLTAFFTMLFDLTELVEMMSIGTLLAYSLVCTSVLILRYQVQKPAIDQNGSIGSVNIEQKPDDNNVVDSVDMEKDVVIAGVEGEQVKKQFIKVLIGIISIWILSIAFSISARFGEDLLLSGNTFIILLFSGLLIGIIICLLWLAMQIQDKQTLEKLHFKVPWVPLLPVTAIVFNIVLMVRLSYVTWIRFSVWLALGFLLYFGYGIRHSKMSSQYRSHNTTNEDELPMLENAE